MAIIALISEYGAWSWLVAGFILLGLELVAPGGVLVWLGVAAILTGLTQFVLPVAWAVQFLVFGILGLVAIVLWLRLVRGRRQESDRPLLNQRAQRFVGQVVVLDEPIVDGFGRVPLGDTVWRIAGPDLDAGQKVRIIGHEGAVLRIEPIVGSSS